MNRPAHDRAHDLFTAARRARGRAHAPYSKFRVGAAVLDDRGRIHAGCNVENASYGLSVCAERNAIASAIQAGAKRIDTIAIVTDARPLAAPCGACRQVLAEFGDDELAILLAGTRGSSFEAFTLRDLLPRTFRFGGPPI